MDAMNARIEKITPGQWVAPSAGVWTADGSMMVADLGSREVTRSRKRAGRIDVRADARLIAAAPEQHDALIVADRVMDEVRAYLQQNDFPSAHAAELAEAQRIVRAAIAKAVTP